MSLVNTLYNHSVRILQTAIETVACRRRSFFTKRSTLLLLKLDSIGDYILFRDLIQVVRQSEKYKNYKITLCGNLWWKDLAEQLDATYIDEFIWVEYAKMTDFNYRFNLFRKIHSKGYEVLLHPTYSRDNASDNIVIHSGAKYRIGYNGNFVNISQAQKERNDLAYTTLIAPSAKCLFEFYRNRYFFEQVLAQTIPMAKPQLHLPTSTGNKIIVCPGAKEYFRRWPPQSFAALCDMLQADFPASEFIICGSAADTVFAKEISAHSVINFTDYTGKLALLELVQLLSQARLVLANDSGPFHIATALNKKVACIANGSHYGRFTPYPKEMATSGIVIFPDELLKISTEDERLRLYCTPRSPIDIATISADTVYQQIKTMLLST